jgi:hypothetical protein
MGGWEVIGGIVMIQRHTPWQRKGGREEDSQRCLPFSADGKEKEETH